MEVDRWLRSCRADTPRMSGPTWASHQHRKGGIRPQRALELFPCPANNRGAARCTTSRVLRPAVPMARDLVRKNGHAQTKGIWADDGTRVKKLLDQAAWFQAERFSTGRL